MKHTLSVMDSSGDRKAVWDDNDVASMKEARQLFDAIRASGGQVFHEQRDGFGGGVVKEFDPKADMIGVPRIVGG
jgi:hypothetical protein